MLTSSSAIRFPAEAEVSQRGEERVYWSPHAGVAVKVKLAAALVLESCREADRVDVVIQRVAERLGVGPERAEPGVLTVLNKVAQAGFFDEKDNTEACALAPAEFAPIILYLHLTERCNLRCVYCYNEDQRTNLRHEPVLTRDEFLDLIDRAFALGIRQFIFTGGEPLLSPNWEVLADRVRALGATAVLLTNGSLIDSANAPKLARLFVSTIVSLDSPDDKINDLTRGLGAYDRIVAGIEALCATGYSGLIIRPIITRHNVSTLPHFPAFVAKRWGVTRFAVTSYIPNSLEEEAGLMLSPDPEVYHTAMAEFRSQLKELGGETINLDNENEGRVRCGAGSAILSVEFNGDVYPCQSLHHPLMRLGNVREADLYHIGVTASAAKIFRTIHVNDVEVCCSCAFKAICGGGCRAVAWRLYGRLDAFIPRLCVYNKAHAWDHIWQGIA